MVRYPKKKNQGEVETNTLKSAPFAHNLRRGLSTNFIFIKTTCLSELKSENHF